MNVIPTNTLPNVNDFPIDNGLPIEMEDMIIPDVDDIYGNLLAPGNIQGFMNEQLPDSDGNLNLQNVLRLGWKLGYESGYIDGAHDLFEHPNIHYTHLTNNNRVTPPPSPLNFGGKKWSLKYKRSINCKKPKGFSQKQYCKRKNKRTTKKRKSK